VCGADDTNVDFLQKVIDKEGAALHVIEKK
jgi:hypothetical protein